MVSDYHELTELLPIASSTPVSQKQMPPSVFSGQPSSRRELFSNLSSTIDHDEASFSSALSFRTDISDMSGLEYDSIRSSNQSVPSTSTLRMSAFDVPDIISPLSPSPGHSENSVHPMASSLAPDSPELSKAPDSPLFHSSHESTPNRYLQSTSSESPEVSESTTSIPTHVQTPVQKHQILGPCNCRLNCISKIPQNRRVEIHDAYWQQTYAEQRNWIANRRYKAKPNNKKYSYFMNDSY